jgi:NAD(P)-dependent dehydrogenase (short-subunit alcohol dehydrogenase family)
LSIAESFAKAGVEQLVFIQRRQELLDNAKKTLEAEYPNTKVTTYAASVMDFDKISSILKEVGKIDILVPNVATSHYFAPSSEISTEDFKKTIDTNLTSTYHIIKEFLALEVSRSEISYHHLFCREPARPAGNYRLRSKQSGLQPDDPVLRHGEHGHRRHLPDLSPRRHLHRRRCEDNA